MTHRVPSAASRLSASALGQGTVAKALQSAARRPSVIVVQDFGLPLRQLAPACQRNTPSGTSWPT